MKQLQQLNYFFLPFTLLLISCFASAQPLLKNEATAPAAANTYAVIIGISKYLDPDIKSLQFPNRDAQFFADFLMSASGGSVPKEHIKLLIDDAATTGEVDKAIIWVKNNCKAGDKVFIYFSGHGELENESMFRDGYLICYNTPSTAFVRMGLSIDWLNKMAGTISDKQADVVIITDACHSGRVAKNAFRGSILVGQQLMNATEKEIRMASCTPEQLSIEKADWGGGRGVFSYHLINGLQGGLADKNSDGIVTSGEIKSYVEYQMAHDSVLKRDEEVQTPVIKGRADFQLSTVVAADAAIIKKMVTEDSMVNVMLSASMANATDEKTADPESYFFELLRKENLEQLTKRSQLELVPTEQLPFAIIEYFLMGDITQARNNKVLEFETMLKNDPQKLERFRIDLASAFTDRGQEIVLQYLKGDEAELEQRRYYNSNSADFDVYVTMFDAAERLAKSDRYLSTNSEVLKHYFSAVALRLKILQTAKPDSLIKKAFEELNKALALEEHAAYIYNELGILYEYKRNFASAEKNYLKATQLSPRWALPYSNLCGLYAANGFLEKSATANNTAISLQPNLLPVKLNKANLDELKGNNLLAEETYHQAIEMNARHFAAFERLGFLNLNSTNYAMADSFFYEAAERKKNYHFEANVWDPRDTRALKNPPPPGMICDFEWRTLEPADVLGNFSQAIFEYSRVYDIEKAKNYYETVLVLDPTNPLAYHYLGQIYVEQQKWEQAESKLTMAIKYHLDSPGIARYTDSLSKILNFPYEQTCFKELFISYQYPAEADHFLLGAVYKSWKHAIDAERYFKSGISMNEKEIGGYAALWNLYEDQGRYFEAEDVIKKAGNFNKEQSEAELNAFYRRRIEESPDDAGWNYKLGILLYDRAQDESKVQYLDSIIYFPLLKEEIFIDQDYFNRLATDEKLVVAANSLTDEFGKFSLRLNAASTKAVYQYTIPATTLTVRAAGKILLPRKDGIIALTKAAELIADKKTLADINFRIARIYQWAGSKKQAWPYLEKSLSFNPDDANVRMALIDIYRSLYKNTDAVKQLTYLRDNNQANVDYSLLLAVYNIQAGQYANADSLLGQASAIAPQKTVEIEELRRKLIFLSKEPTEAIKYYKAYLGKNTTDAMASYSMARLYAKNGRSSEAFKYLETAIKEGFNYFYVLQNDPYMNGLKKNKKWMMTFNSLKAHVYSSTAKIN